MLCLLCSIQARVQVEARLQELLDRQQALQTRRGVLQRVVAQDERAPQADWQKDFPWDADALALLHTRFRLKDFR